MPSQLHDVDRIDTGPPLEDEPAAPMPDFLGITPSVSAGAMFTRGKLYQTMAPTCSATDTSEKQLMVIDDLGHERVIGRSVIGRLGTASGSICPHLNAQKNYWLIQSGLIDQGRWWYSPLSVQVLGKRLAVGDCFSYKSTGHFVNAENQIACFSHPNTQSREFFDSQEVLYRGQGCEIGWLK